MHVLNKYAYIIYIKQPDYLIVFNHLCTYSGCVEFGRTYVRVFSRQSPLRRSVRKHYTLPLFIISLLLSFMLHHFLLFFSFFPFSLFYFLLFSLIFCYLIVPLSRNQTSIMYSFIMIHLLLLITKLYISS